MSPKPKWVCLSCGAQGATLRRRCPECGAKVATTNFGLVAMAALIFAGGIGYVLFSISERPADFLRATVIVGSVLGMVLWGAYFVYIKK